VCIFIFLIDVSDVFESVSVSSHEYQNDILHVIQRGYKDRDSEQQFVYSNPRLVHNSQLLETVSYE
jgi:hypothetical protein